MENDIFKAIACKVAYELGYSKKAIIRCYERGMRAGDLVTKILELEESNPEYTFEGEEIKSKKDDDDESSRQLERISVKTDIKGLRKDTLNLWKKQQCHSCWKYKSNRLALPCTHLAICENCISDKCIICNEVVTDWIKIHM